jgi:hypothetical protein
LRHSLFEAAGVQEWGSSTNFSRIEILGEKTSRLGAFYSEKVLGRRRGAKQTYKQVW